MLSAHDCTWACSCNSDVGSANSASLIIRQTFHAFQRCCWHSQGGWAAQTVIECLKQACTGELPPNTRSGQSFIHDPKVPPWHAPATCPMQLELFIQPRRQRLIGILPFLPFFLDSSSGRLLLLQRRNDVSVDGCGGILRRQVLNERGGEGPDPASDPHGTAGTGGHHPLLPAHAEKSSTAGAALPRGLVLAQRHFRACGWRRRSTWMSVLFISSPY